MMLSQEFFNWKQAQQKVNHCSKKIAKGEKERRKKIKNEKPKDIGPFFVQISVHAQAKML